MSASVQYADKAKVKELILEMKGGSLTDYEHRVMNSCMSGTTKTWIGTIDGKPVCVWGLIPPTLVSDLAYLWLHCGDIEGNEFIFVRWSQRVVEELLKLYPNIIGHCEINNEKAISWVKWLGGRFSEPEGRLIPFVIRG